MKHHIIALLALSSLHFTNARTSQLCKTLQKTRGLFSKSENKNLDLFFKLNNNGNAGNIMQKRTLLSAANLKGTDSVIAKKYRHLSPSVGASMMPVVKNLYDYGDEDCPMAQLVKDKKFGLFHKGSDGVNPTKHKGMPGASLDATLAGTVLGHLENDRLQEEDVQAKITKQWRQTHRATFGKKSKLSAGKVRSLLNTLVQAKELSTNKKNKPAPYPYYYPYGILTSALWQKATQKTELNEYMHTAAQHTPLFCTKKAQLGSRLLTDESYRPEELAASEDWTETIDHYFDTKKDLHVASIESHDNYERVVAHEIDRRDFGNPWPPMIKYTHLGFKEQTPWATCVEATLRDLCNLILTTSQKTFNIELLPQTLKLNKNFINFYRTHANFDKVHERNAHQAWMDMVSGHKNVIYRQNNDEDNAYIIASGLDNFLRVLNILFGTHAQDYQALAKLISTEQQTIEIHKIGEHQLYFMITKPSGALISAYVCVSHNGGHTHLETPQRVALSQTEDRMNLQMLSQKNKTSRNNSKSNRFLPLNNLITQRLCNEESPDYLVQPHSLAGLHHLALSAKQWPTSRDWNLGFAQRMATHHPHMSNFAISQAVKSAVKEICEQIDQSDDYKLLLSTLQHQLTTCSFDNLAPEIIKTFDKKMQNEIDQNTTLRTTLLAFFDRLGGINARLGYAGDSILDRAASYSDKTIHLLLKLGADPNKSPDLLYNAYNGNRMHQLKLLKDYGVSVDAKSSKGVTALHIACNDKNQTVALKLVQLGANIHARSEDGMTPIDIALKWNNQAFADALIKEYKKQHSAPTDYSPTLIDSVKLGYFYAKKKATELFSRLKFW